MEARSSMLKPLLSQKVEPDAPRHEVEISLASAACLSVVMPCYNEVGTVDEVIRCVLTQSVVAELIIVDDGSTDGSGELIESWRSRDNRVLVFHRGRNQCKGAALHLGFAATRALLVAVQDADMEYNPADLSRLVEPLLRGEASVVYGSRFAAGAGAETVAWHRWGNRLLTGLANRITGQRLTDEATCYKVFRREVLLSLDLSEDGFGFCAEVTAKLSRRGVKIMEVPIRYRARSRAEGKKLRLRDGWKAIRCLLKYSFRREQPKGESGIS